MDDSSNTKSCVKRPSGTQNLLCHRHRHVTFSNQIQFFPHSPRASSIEKNSDELSDVGKSVYFKIYADIKNLRNKTADEIRQEIRNKWHELSLQKKRNAHLDFVNQISDSKIIDNEWVTLTAQQKQDSATILINEWIKKLFF